MIGGVPTFVLFVKQLCSPLMNCHPCQRWETHVGFGYQMGHFVFCDLALLCHFSKKLDP